MLVKIGIGFGIFVVFVLIAFILSKWESFREFWTDLMSLEEHKVSILGYMSGIIFVFTIIMAWIHQDIPSNLLTFAMMVIGSFAGTTTIYSAVTNITSKVKGGNLSGALTDIKEIVTNSETENITSSDTTTLTEDEPQI